MDQGPHVCQPTTYHRAALQPTSILRQDPTTWPRLALNSLCGPGGPCGCLPQPLSWNCMLAPSGLVKDSSSPPPFQRMRLKLRLIFESNSSLELLLSFHTASHMTTFVAKTKSQNPWDVPQWILDPGKSRSATGEGAALTPPTVLGSNPGLASCTPAWASPAFHSTFPY